MDKHEFRLIWLFTGYGLISGVGMIFLLPAIIEQLASSNSIFAEKDGLSFTQTMIAAFVVIQTLVILLVGLMGAVTKSISNVLFPIAGVFLAFSFPVGTVISIYYFWYTRMSGIEREAA